MVRTNTLVLPGMGAGVVRVKGTSRALALSVDCNARFVYLDPFLGAQHAVAEAARNVACAGGLPIGATNCLNFGNPQRPEIMWQFARAVEGMGEACRALDIPITGGNVSLYNETDGRGVLPTPVIGVVGLLEDASRVVRRPFQASGDVVVLLGRSRAELGGSEYLHVVHGMIRGVPPALDLGQEACAAGAAGGAGVGRARVLGARLRRGWAGRGAGGVLLRFGVRRGGERGRRGRRGCRHRGGGAGRRGRAVRRVGVARGRVGAGGACRRPAGSSRRGGRAGGGDRARRRRSRPHRRSGADGDRRAARAAGADLGVVDREPLRAGTLK